MARPKKTSEPSPPKRAKTIWIDTDVWSAVQKKGRFGENPNAVIRRLIGLPPNQQRKSYGS